MIKIGFTNYIILKNNKGQKLAIEISRHVNYNSVQDIEYNIEVPEFYKEVKNITIADIGEIIKYAKDRPYFSYPDEFLVQWANEAGKNYQIIDEYAFNSLEDKEDYFVFSMCD